MEHFDELGEADSLPQYDSQNRELPTIQYPVVVGKDEYFVLALYHPKSFDSRYFGSVSLNQIIGKIKPVWVLGDYDFKIFSK